MLSLEMVHSAIWRAIGDGHIRAAWLEHPLHFFQHSGHIDESILATEECIDCTFINSDVEVVIGIFEVAHIHEFPYNDPRLHFMLVRFAFRSLICLITTSEISVAMTLDTPQGSVQKELSEEVIASLSEFCEVSVESGLCLVAVIGNRLTQTNTRVLEVMSPFDVRLICHGASEHNLCFLLPEDKATQAIAGLHGQLLS